MSARAARIVLVAILVGAVVSATTSVVVSIAARDQVEVGRIYVHGDLETPGMRETLRELEHSADRGAELASSIGGPTDPEIVLAMLVLLLWIGVGVVIVWRQPRNWAGWLFVITGAPLPYLFLLQVLITYGVKVDPGGWIPVAPLAVIAEHGIYPLALLPLLFLLYPDGRLPSRRWRWAVIGLVGGTALAILGFVFRPGPLNNLRDDGILFENPLGIDALPWAGAVIGIGAAMAIVSALSTPIAVILRFRRSTGEDRKRMRLLAFVAATAGSLLAAMFLFGLVAGFLKIDRADDRAIFPILFGLLFTTIAVGTPGAYLISIFRHGLWDLDLVIRKAVIFAVVAGAITIGAFVVVLVIPMAVFGTGIDQAGLGLLVAGVVIGALIGRVRRWARRVADRLVFGHRATPYEVLTSFSERLAETYATDDVLPRMARVVAEGTGATVARVHLRVGSELREVAAWPALSTPDPAAFGVPVTHQGEDLGALDVTMPANDPKDDSKERLLRDVAGQAGLVLRNVKLIEELRASRQRLVAAQDEERRKLERNLHDGAQQQLVALQVQLRLVEQLVGRDPDKEREMLHRLQGGAVAALEDLRELARGIYPPLLADQGLGAALASQARKASISVEVEAGELGRYARDVESAVYFCSLEALNNVAKYANATSARIRLAQRNGTLEFEVIDDGAGFDPDRTGYGTGLQGMADRLDAIGGTLEVRSAPGAGTTIVGQVPADPPPAS